MYWRASIFVLSFLLIKIQQNSYRIVSKSLNSKFLGEADPEKIYYILFASGTRGGGGRGPISATREASPKKIWVVEKEGNTV